MKAHITNAIDTRTTEVARGTVNDFLPESRPEAIIVHICLMDDYSARFRQGVELMPRVMESIRMRNATIAQVEV